MQRNFGFRVKIGEYELEINGAREEVLGTIEELPSLMASIHEALEIAKPKKVATLTVRTQPSRTESQTEKYPNVSPTESCDEAIIKTLETDWGKWRPRTLDEMRKALQANGMSYSERTLTGVLTELSKKGKIRRWNTDTGYVYILVGKEALA